MQVLNAIDTSICATNQPDMSMTVTSLCTAAHENGSYALLLNSVNERNPNGHRNVIGVYRLDSAGDYINYRHQFAMQVSDSFVGQCIAATSPHFAGRNAPAAGAAESWVIVGGSEKSAAGGASSRSPALWLSPMVSTSDKSVARSSAILPVPTTSTAKNSAISHAAFVSTHEAVIATTDGRFGIFDIETASLTSPDPVNGLSAVPGLAGMRPTNLVAAEDPTTFFVSSGRLVARVDTRTPGAFAAHRPAQMWLWHPHDRISAVNFESFTTSREIVCGSDDGTVMLFDTRSPQQQLAQQSSSPWQVNPRPGTSISGVGRVAGSGSICVSWNDGVIGGVDVVTAPNSESKCTIRVISKNDDIGGSKLLSKHNEDAAMSSQQHQLLSTPSHEFAHDSAVADNNTGSVVLCQEKGLAVVSTRRGTVSVVGYR